MLSFTLRRRRAEAEAVHIAHERLAERPLLSSNVDRQLSTLEIRTMNVAEGSAVDLRELNLDAEDLPVEMACHTADSWVRHVRPAGACE